MAVVRCPSCGFYADLNNPQDPDFTVVNVDNTQHALTDAGVQASADTVAAGVASPTTMSEV